MSRWISGLLTTICCVASASAEKMYWTHNDVGDHRIQRSDLDGGNLEDFLPDAAASGVALDLVNGKLYWAGRVEVKGVPGPTGIHRVALDGSGIETLPLPCDPKFRGCTPVAIRLDLLDRRIYWTLSDFTVREAPAVIRRAKFDGTDAETVVDDIGDARGIALDLHGRKIYWTERVPGRIRRANLDGSNVEDLVTGVREAWGIALDLRDGLVYWSGPGIHTANLDGTNVKTIGGTVGPGIALDLLNRKIYLAEGALRRMNLDGSGAETLLTIVEAKARPGIALDLCGRKPGGLRWDDHDAYLDCLIGPDHFSPASCHCSDFSGDAHVDLKDFALLQRAFTTE